MTGSELRRREKVEQRAEIRAAKKAAKHRGVIKRLNGRYNAYDLNVLYFKPCIYFLKCKGTLVYIGETTSVMQRISQHIVENVKVFDSFSFEIFEGSTAERKAEEASLINSIKPFYNKVHIKDKEVKIYGITADII